MHHVTLIPGDGVGPEICEAARRCLDATGIPFAWEIHAAGLDALSRTGSLLPQSTLDAVRRTGAALKGPVSTPPGAGWRSVNVHLRQALDLYACVRPCKLFPGVQSFFRGLPIDLVIIRENTEDLYAGVEFEAGKPDTKDLIGHLNARTERPIRADSGLSVKPISESASRRIVKFAFEYCRKLGRKKLTAVHKANIMRLTDGLFLQTARTVARDYPDVLFEDRIVDNMCMQLVQKPTDYDVLVMSNLYGDILSDLVAGIVGGLGVAASANLGAHAAVFEAIHGSAPKYKGQNKVNPTGLLLAAVMLLRHLEEKEAADRLENAVVEVLREGKFVTYDLRPSREGGVGTREMADAIISRMLKS